MKRMEQTVRADDKINHLRGKAYLCDVREIILQCAIVQIFEQHNNEHGQR